MNYKMMGRFVALILLATGVFMIPALILSIWDGEVGAIRGFLITIGVTALLGGGLLLLSRGAGQGFFAKEGMASVGIGWIVMSLVGCLPFCISGEIPRFVDALFEIVSGFTTTGSSICTDVEALSRGILYWRSFSHWVGGMGVLVFLLAIVPKGGRNEGFTMHLLRAESPGPDVGKLVPKMRTTAMVLYVTYIVLTFANVIALLICGMDPFEAICTAFGTAGTGGFGVRNDSLAGYSDAIQIVTTVFMFLFGVNFGCYFLLLTRQFKSFFRDEELRMYFFLALSGIVLIAFNIFDLYKSVGETIKHAAFQVVSVMTTTGFATADFDLWPSFSKTLLVILMFIGACAGSTGGGMKCIRVMFLFKGIGRNINKILQPQRVQPVRSNGKIVDELVLANTNAYFAAYIIILLLSLLIVSLDGFGFTTNFTAVLTCLNNIGPGLEEVGPSLNFSKMSDLSKIVLSLNMLIGRLEIFPILILFHYRTWKRK